MTNNDTSRGRPLSRRAFFVTAAAGGGAIIALGLAPTEASGSAKLPQKAVKYQAIPKKGNRCSNCTLWQLPASCKAVEGPISPAGWCTLYAAKK